MSETAPLPLAELPPHEPLTADDIIVASDGSCTIADAHFTSYNNALEFVTAKNALEAQLANTVAFEQLLERQQAMLEALRANTTRLTHEVARLQQGGLGDNHETESQLVTSTVAAVLRQSEQAVDGRLSQAAQLAEQYPSTLEAWSAGLIHRGHVRVIQRAGEALTERQRPWFEHEVLAAAADRSPRQLAAVASRVTTRFEQRDPEEVAAEAFAERAAWVEPQNDGMALLVIKTSPVLAEAALNRLSDASRRAAANDKRGFQQRLSDTAMAALITGTCDSGILAGITAKVQITMPATLVTGAEGAERAQLAGGTLIDNGTALALAGQSPSWVRLFTDPASGIAVTADTYQPSASLRRLIIARDQTCRFIGCSRPAMHCDIDHTEAWEHGGKSTPDNLAVLCRHHHTLKHRLGPNQGWRVRQLASGVLEWSSPNGTVHRVEPEPVPTAIVLDPSDPTEPPEPDPPLPDDGTDHWQGPGQPVTYAPF